MALMNIITSKKKTALITITGNKSSWCYVKNGYIKKSSARDQSVYRIKKNPKFKKIIYPWLWAHHLIMIGRYNPYV